MRFSFAGDTIENRKLTITGFHARYRELYQLRTESMAAHYNVVRPRTHTKKAASATPMHMPVASNWIMSTL